MAYGKPFPVILGTLQKTRIDEIMSSWPFKCVSGKPPVKPKKHLDYSAKFWSTYVQYAYSAD